MTSITAPSHDRRRGDSRLRYAAMAGLLLMIVSGLLHAQATETRAFDIPAGSLMEAMDRFGEQSDLQVTYDPELLKGKSAPAVTGKLDVSAALAELLAGSGLESAYVNSRTIVIRPEARPARQDRPSETRRDDDSASAKTPVTLESMTVTGTRIRGGSTPSPMTTIDAARIREEGFVDLGEVIRSIPQNYSGGQNPGVVNGQVGGVANMNLGGASSLNLRGLGPDATLTLLNGRRMAYGGLYQSVDISAIPVEAVQRVEVVTDGGSAIYGSDAIGGVGNVILKRNFDGVALGTRYGSASSGGMVSREYNATAGSAWASGGLIATYKKMSTDPIYAGQRSYTSHLTDPTTIYPGSDLRSGLVSAFQMLGDNLELRIDAFRTQRDQLQYASQPAFVNRSQPTTTTQLVSPSVEIFLPGDWAMSFGGTWGTDSVVTSVTRTMMPAGAPALVGNVQYRNTNRTYDVSAEGPLFTMRGGDARLAIGGGSRTNDFRQHNFLSGAGGESAETSRFAYVEASFPLIGPGDGTASRSLTLTAAARGEDYDSFGSVVTPKIGFVYSPNTDFTVKASWGKSFKAPTLNQRNGTQWVYLDPASALGVTGVPAGSTVLSTSGGNPDLGPERARTWTGSLVFHPRSLAGLETEASIFDIQYTQRVVLPGSVSQSLNNPAYAPLVTYAPTPAMQAKVLADPRVQFINLAGADYDPAKVVAFVFGQYFNATAQRVRGLDLAAGYGFDLRGGRLSIRGGATLMHSDQRTIAGGERFELAGMLFYPPKTKGRLGTVWNRGALTASGFVNYTGGLTNRADGTKGASFTTFDTTLRYAPGGGNSAWRGLELAISAQNVFNKAPPLYTSNSLVQYRFDSTNYSAVGRSLNASISKRW